jgi:hypothetical protein
MKKILILAVLIFGLNFVADIDAKPRTRKYNYSRYQKTKQRRMRKNKTHKRTCQTTYKHKKCNLCKVYPVR